jgi:DNA invertase Pin-like site-specific DNA recombinase
MIQQIAQAPGVEPGDFARLPTPTGPKIQPRHLARGALIYVRQSHPSQVQRHPESARRQYGLIDRARLLGWPAEQVTVIDDDQGKSAAGSAAAHERDGFGRLVSAVGLGEIGIVLVLEVSRLARNSAEWYRLLELAALAGVLIADDTTIYDPRLFNDRLLLGLRGTISEVELHCIQERLRGARSSKAQRGELRLRLPAGYVYGSDGRVEFDPDQEVQAALRAIFEQFVRRGTASAVLRFCNEHGLTLPRRRWLAQTAPTIVWMRPSYQAIHMILTNPTYAGAYVYGYRRGTPAAVGASGPRRRYALDDVGVLRRDHHPAYLSWEQYLANCAALRDNGRRFPTSRGAPQGGAGLLQGLVVCGRCGCRMQLRYGVPSVAYVCGTRHQRYAEPICQSLTINHVDPAVSAAFLAVIRPADVEAALALAAEREHDRTRVTQQWQLRLERARYEAERARRQYDQVEPEHRLVARELEGRWNERLRALAGLETEYQREQARGLAPVTAEEQAQLARLVEDLPALWAAPETTAEDRKRLLRCLIRAVVLLRDDRPNAAGGITTIRIGWCSGAWSEVRVRRPSSGDHLRTAAPVLERIRTLAEHESDEQIAERLNTEGMTTSTGLPWTTLRVQQRRAYHQIPSGRSFNARSALAHQQGLLSAAEAAAKLGVTRTSLRAWREWGFLQVEQHADGEPRWVRLSDEDLARLDGTRARQGYGRWTVREARRVLEVGKEELWAQARTGRLVAYRAIEHGHSEWRLSPAADAPPASVTGTTSTPLDSARAFK